jgi:hypothetical protein
MSLSQAAYQVEKAIGHRDNAETEQDITNPAQDREKYGHPTETMQALVWQGKNSVEVGMRYQHRTYMSATDPSSQSPSLAPSSLKIAMSSSRLLAAQYAARTSTFSTAVSLKCARATF